MAESVRITPENARYLLARYGIDDEFMRMLIEVPVDHDGLMDKKHVLNWIMSQQYIFGMFA